MDEKKTMKYTLPGPLCDPNIMHKAFPDAFRRLLNDHDIERKKYQTI